MANLENDILTVIYMDANLDIDNYLCDKVEWRIKNEKN